MPAHRDYLESRLKDLPECVRPIMEIALEIRKAAILIEYHRMAIEGLKWEFSHFKDKDFRIARIIQIEWLLENLAKGLDNEVL